MVQLSLHALEVCHRQSGRGRTLKGVRPLKMCWRLALLELEIKTS